jgi:hypothetical protein
LGWARDETQKNHEDRKITENEVKEKLKKRYCMMQTYFFQKGKLSSG